MVLKPNYLSCKHHLGREKKKAICVVAVVVFVLLDMNRTGGVRVLRGEEESWGEIQFFKPFLVEIAHILAELVYAEAQADDQAAVKRISHLGT